MDVLVIGSGAREHCLLWKIRQSPLAGRLYCAPGNAGTAGIAENVPIAADDLGALADWATSHRIGLTIVGPEAPLTAGIADLFLQRGLAVFGPSKGAARIEGSKVWSKELMLRHGIPTGRAAVFRDSAQAKEYVCTQPMPIVIKADGLAAGKGVIVAATLEDALEAVRQIMDERVFGDAGERILVEEFLSGPEVSVLAITDGETVLTLPPACDYKRVGDGDLGPNTGGMGAYSPPGFVPPAFLADIEERVMRPTVRALAAEGYPYRGVLYAGIMLTTAGPKTLEFNCRFGDPETQVILPRLRSDLLALAVATVEGRLASERLDCIGQPSCGVVLAAGGYPGKYRNGLPIDGSNDLGSEALVFHAGTTMRDGQVVTAGGRVLTVVAIGRDMAEARAHAYRRAGQIEFEGCHYRKDIALREVTAQ